MTATSPSIAQRIDAIIAREGGYSDHPADRGGPTCWGITEQVARAFGYAGDMRALPRVIAVEIYAGRYWSAPRFDRVAERYGAVASELFDIGVNMGVGVAGGFLQRALNALNTEGAHYADVTPDGGIGALTLHALDCYRQRRGAEGGEVLLEAIRSLRGARYIEISEKRSKNEAFTYGWFRRMVEMLRERRA